jgi:hypothetical protein
MKSLQRIGHASLVVLDCLGSNQFQTEMAAELAFVATENAAVVKAPLAGQNATQSVRTRAIR